MRASKSSPPINADTPGAVAPTVSASYAESRKTLRAIADQLRTDTEIDIDELIPLIDRASAAYKICRERVDAVEKLIAERLPQAGQSGFGESDG